MVGMCFCYSNNSLHLGLRPRSSDQIFSSVAAQQNPLSPRFLFTHPNPPESCLSSWVFLDSMLQHDLDLGSRPTTIVAESVTSAPLTASWRARGHPSTTERV